MASADDILKEDALNRGVFANNLAGLIGKLDRGVIAVDGAWGAGKSWLGSLLKAKLDGDAKLKTVWLDAFAADWDDDPVLTLLAELLDQLPEAKRDEYVQKVAPLLGKVVTATTKAGLRAVGNFVGIDKETTDEVIKSLQDAEEAYFKSQLEKLRERKKSLQALKELLAHAVQESGGRVVIFIDELDRCSPPFAIRFLERIKHLFDVKGAVFVLLWNREQIHQAVRAFYGQETDGPMYLDRFVDYSFHLPNFHLQNAPDGLGLLIEKKLLALKAPEYQRLNEIGRLLAEMATFLGLSARELGHVCDLWLLFPNKQSLAWELWLLCLKVKEPDVYALLRVEQAEGHLRAREKILKAANADGQFSPVFSAIAQFHLMCQTRDVSNIDANVRTVFGSELISSMNSAASRTIGRFEIIG